jgi:hypothetical protein
LAIAIVAAEAWGLAEKKGLVQKQGGPRQKAQNGLIAHPREHFAELFGVSKNYVEMARALLRGDAQSSARSVG